MVRQGIVPGTQLVKGLLRRAVHLQLHDVGRAGHVDHHVGTTAGALHLRADVDVQHREYQVEGVFVEALRRGGLSQLLLESLNVGDACQIGLKLTQGQVKVFLPQRTPELDGEPGLYAAAVKAGVGGQQATREAQPHLAVRYGEQVHVRVTVVSLDGQVAALVEQGQGRRHGLRGDVERLDGLFHVLQGSDVGAV